LRVGYSAKTAKAGRYQVIANGITGETVRGEVEQQNGRTGEWEKRNKRIGEPESGRKGVIETVVGENGRTEEVNRRAGDREKKRGR
jgi:hypothetical protein